jgi:hypothetical protein
MSFKIVRRTDHLAFRRQTTDSEITYHSVFVNLKPIAGFISFQVSLSHCFSIRMSALVCRTNEDWRKTNPKVGLVKPASMNFPTEAYVQTT